MDNICTPDYSDYEYENRISFTFEPHKLKYYTSPQKMDPQFGEGGGVTTVIHFQVDFKKS